MPPIKKRKAAGDVPIAEQRKSESESYLFPPLEPYKTGVLTVGIHDIYWEACGNPKGKPVIILHGGPGAGCSPKQRRFHDPAKHHIVLFDQRGCGRSMPDGCLESNTTWDLVADIERLRLLFGIDKWQVFGGSWGSTLALAYAVTHPLHVSSLVLRGIFLVKQAELDYIYQTATPMLFPEAYEPIVAWLAPEERRDLVSAYRKRILSGEAATALRAAQLWCQWEDAISCLYPDSPSFEGSGGEQRIHLHYMWSRGFFECETSGQPLEPLLLSTARAECTHAVSSACTYATGCSPHLPTPPRISGTTAGCSTSSTASVTSRRPSCTAGATRLLEIDRDRSRLVEIV